MQHETDVIPLAGQIRAPVFLAYGVDDTFVPWQRNSVPMADALRAAGRVPVRIEGYRGGHDPELIDDPSFGTSPDAWRLFADEVSFLTATIGPPDIPSTPTTAATATTAG
jgi:hypothetical protein